VRIALDTNVLISAYTARGLSSDVYRLILAEHELVLPQFVVAEFERVLIKKFGVPERLVAEIVEELMLHEVIPTPDLGTEMEVIRDPDDRLVVAAAVFGLAEILITGDRDILDAKDKISSLMILTPRGFWESIRKGA